MGIKRIRRRNIRDHLLRYPVASTSTWKSSGSDGSNVSSNSKDGTTLTHSSSTSLASFRKEDPNANKNSKNSNQKNALWTVHEKPLLPTKKKAVIRAPKLRVRFQKQVRVKPTLHHQNYTHQEKTACWYGKEDYTTMHEHVYMIVEFHKLLQQQTTTTTSTTSSTRPAKSSLPSISLKTSPALEEEAAVLCTRGLEGYLTTRESNSKTTNGAHAHRNRHRAIHAVLTEQEQQQEQQEAMALASSSILLAYGYDTEKIRAVYQSHTHPAEQNAQALGRTDAITAGITGVGSPAPSVTRRPTHHHTKKRTAADPSKDTVWRHCGTLSAAHDAIEDLDQQIGQLEQEQSDNTKQGISLMESLFPDVALEAASLQLLGRSPPAPSSTVATTMPTSTGTTPAVATTISSTTDTDALLTSSLSSWSAHIKGGTTTELTSPSTTSSTSTSTSTDLFQVQNPATHAVSPWNFTTR